MLTQIFLVCFAATQSFQVFASENDLSRFSNDIANVDEHHAEIDTVFPNKSISTERKGNEFRSPLFAVNYSDSPKYENTTLDIVDKRTLQQSVAKLPIRINCGNDASDYIDSNGVAWLKDQFVVNGLKWDACSAADSIAAKLSNVDCTQRYGDSIEYNVPVPKQGDYKVTVYFTEVYFTQPKQRAFTIVGEGITIVNNIDLVAEFGSFKPGSRSSKVSVQDGLLAIKFLNGISAPVINGIVIEDWVSSVPNPSPTTLSTVMINAGSNSDWKDPSSGLVWSEDTYYQSGGSFNACPKQIANGPDTLYCDYRVFTAGGAYIIPVQPGQYNIQLLFAETWFTDPKKRVFNVVVQGVTVKSSLDVFAEVGANAAYKITVTNVKSDPSSIKIEFVNVVENAIINAIQVTPSNGGTAPTPPQSSPLSPIPQNTPTSIQTIAIRINAGASTSYTDPAGNVWSADNYFGGGGTYSNCPLGIDGTDLDPLFCSERFFSDPSPTSGSYSIPVPPGSYKVRLMFAEIFFTSNSARVFKVLVQGKQIEAALDIYAKVGPTKAYIVETPVSIDSSTNSVKIDIVNVIQNGKINAIEILSSSGPTPNPPSGPSGPVPAPPVALSTIRIGAGATSNFVDPNNGNVWSADNYFQGGGTYSNCPKDIDGTSLDSLYCSERFFTGPAGASSGYIIPVQPGQYNVKLMFAEIFFSTSNARVFKILINDNIIQPALDVYAASGPNKAYDINNVVSVSGGSSTIKITFVNIVENAKVNAIEIVPSNGQVTPTSPTQPISPPTTQTQSAIRINVGSPVDWTDPSTGAVWSADKGFDSGLTYSACPLSISGTEKDTLFCSDRYWPGPPGTIGRYSFQLNPGLYAVKLLFAEIYFTSPQQRVFQVSVQGKVVIDSLDIVQMAGVNAAYEVTTLAAVSPVSAANSLLIELKNINQFAKLSAIEINASSGAPSPTPQLTTAIRINCGYNLPYVDSDGMTWAPDQFYSGGLTSSKVVPDIQNTDNDLLFYYERVDASFAYNIPVSPGIYKVTLYFAETRYGSAGDRVFDITVGNSTTKNYDILKTVQAATATFLEIFELVDGGQLTIQLSKAQSSPNSGFPKLNAILVELDVPHIAHAVAQGPYVGTDVDGSGKGKIMLLGETSHTHGPGLSLTDVTWKEGTTVLGKTLNLDYSFPVGKHSVSLTVKDSGKNENTEKTTVTIQPFGFPAITQLSPNSGSRNGNFDVLIKGSGFTYSATDTTVTFGQNVLQGSNSIQVIDAKTIKVTCPPSSFGQPVDVKVKTPLGTSEPVTFNYQGTVDIAWTDGTFLSYSGSQANVDINDSPIIGRFGPDKKLYIGTYQGVIIKITMNEDFTKSIDAKYVLVNSDNTAILGIAFDPLDNKQNPDVYFTSCKFFHKGQLSSSGSTINGKIKRASGPNLETVVTIISGLPVSAYDHGLNAMVFGDSGELYFNTGSNTNGGIPGKLSPDLNSLKENFLSAAVNVAYLSHPDFSGAIKWSAADDGNMIAKGIDIFAAGLRNPFGLVLHSNGKLYATDNGPNGGPDGGYGRMSTGCGVNDDINGVTTEDKILYLVKGNYYGHPNRKRAAYFNDPRQCVWYGPDKKSTNGYTQPLLSAGSARTGITEFHGNHFDKQLRGHLVVVHYGASYSLSRIILNADGTNVIPESANVIPMNIGDQGLDVTQAPNGNLIEIRYSTRDLHYYKPNEPPASQLIVKTVFPRRGGVAGGNTLTIYGENFVNNPTVKVGQTNCPVTSISLNKIECTLPGGFGTFDITVSNGSASSTFEKGYRYVSGILPPEFVLPVYQ